MKTNSKHFIHLIICFLVITIYSVSYAEEASLIMLKDGVKYENVSFEINRESQEIYINNQQKDMVQFIEIEAIYNKDGFDISEELLYIPTPEELERMAAYNAFLDEKYKKPFRFYIRTGSCFSIPLDEYYERFTSGFGYGIDVAVPLISFFSIKAQISKAGIKPGNKIDDILDIDVWRYFIGGEIYNDPKIWGKTYNTYIFVGFGAVSNKLTDKAYPSQSISITKFSATIGAGIIPMLTHNVGLDLGFGIDYLFVGWASSKEDPIGSAQIAFILDLKLGLVIKI